MKLIDLHKKWMRTGMMDDTGLCNSTPYKYRKTLDLFEPNTKEHSLLFHTYHSNLYWASGLKVDDDNKFYTYTPLRQAIVLLICAMHNEL